MKQLINYIAISLTCGLMVYAYRETTIACSENENVDPCMNPCQPTCDEPVPPVCNFLVCNQGCACKKNLLRDRQSGECVPPNQCPPSCPVNARWTDCGTGCRVTCRNVNDPPICTAQCVEPMCICKSGFIFDENVQRCVLPEECSPAT